MRDHESNQESEAGVRLTTLIPSLSDEPPAAAVALAGRCLKRLVPLFPALLGQFVRNEKMTKTCVQAWALAIDAAGVEEQDLARAIMQIAKGDGAAAVDPFSFPGVITLAKSWRRSAASAREPMPAAPSAPPASAEKVAAAAAEIKRVMGAVASRSRAAFGTETPRQH